MRAHAMGKAGCGATAEAACGNRERGGPARRLGGEATVGTTCGKIGVLPLMLLVCLFFMPSVPSARAASDETDDVMASAESLFKAMKHKDYSGIWMNLSQKSRKTIAEETYGSMKAEGRREYSVDVVEKDFNGDGPIAKEYWGAFLRIFNPDQALEQSTWEMGYVKKDQAEISLLYQKSENPTKLRMFKENGRWKVGLVESFWGRK